MASWPTSLPGPLREGYGINPNDNVRRTDFEAGAARARVISKARLDRLPVAFRFTEAQMATFRAFYDSDNGAAQGVAWFDMLLDLGNGSKQVVETRFAKPFVGNLSGRFWIVTAELEVR